MLGFLEKLNDNPVYVKEIKLQERLNSRRKFRVPSWSGYLSILLLPMAITVLLGVFSYKLSLNDLKSVFIFSMFLQNLYFIYRGASHAWSLISGEKEMKTYENLISTEMTPLEIVKGKFWSAFSPLAKELIYLFPVFAGIGLLLQIQPYFLIHIFLLTLAFLCFFTVVGLYFSARSKTSTEARNNSVRVIGYLLGGTILLGSIISILLSVLFHSCGAYSLLMIPVMLLLFVNPLAGLWSVSMRILAPSPDGAIFTFFYIFSIFQFFIYITASLILFKKTVKLMEETPG